MLHFYYGKIIIALLFWGNTIVNATDLLPNIIDANRDGNVAEANVQQKIDALSETQRKLFEEYDALSRDLLSLTKHNTQLKRMVDDQSIQRESREESLTSLAETRRQVLPLMMDMVEWLDQLLDADMPFNIQERRLELDDLRKTLDRGDLNLSAQFEQVMAHYQKTLTDGQQVDVYSGALPGDQARKVDFLQIGRLALYYQSLDGKDSAHWNADQQQWEALSPDYNNEIRRAIRIVRKESAPGLLTLPLDPPYQSAARSEQ